MKIAFLFLYFQLLLGFASINIFCWALKAHLMFNNTPSDMLTSSNSSSSSVIYILQWAVQYTGAPHPTSAYGGAEYLGTAAYANVPLQPLIMERGSAE